MIRFTSYANQRHLNNGRSANTGHFTLGRPAHRSGSPLLGAGTGYSDHDLYLLRLRSSEPYMAMLREDWAQEQAALKPVDLKAVYADKDSDHIRV
ncbi:TPA: hypothetical protein ACSP2U_002729, partial [Aeromonas veronii]